MVFVAGGGVYGRTDFRGQLASFGLTHAYEDSLAASRSQRFAAEEFWPAIAAVERLAYRTLSTCWALEQLSADAARETAASMFINNGTTRVREAIDGFITTILKGNELPTLPALPHVLETELVDVRECLLKFGAPGPRIGGNETAAQRVDK